MAKRFKVVQLQTTTRYKGVITLDDLRKKFDIPNHADVSISVPSGMGGELSMGEHLDFGHLDVSWEEVK